MPLRKRPHRIDFNEVPGDGTRAETAKGRQITPDRSVAGTSPLPRRHVAAQLCFVDLIKEDATKMWLKLPEADTISLRGAGFECRQILDRELRQRLVVGPPRSSVPIKLLVLVEETPEEPLRLNPGGRARRPPDLQAPPREPHPPCGTAPIDASQPLSS